MKSRGKELKKKAELVKGIIVDGATGVLSNKNSHMLAMGTGLQQALKYNGNLKNGVKGAVMTYGFLIAGNCVQEFVNNTRIIKK